MTAEVEPTGGYGGPQFPGIHVCEVRGPKRERIPGALLIYDGSRGRTLADAEAEAARQRSVGMRAYVWRM